MRYVVRDIDHRHSVVLDLNTNREVAIVGSGRYDNTFLVRSDAERMARSYNRGYANWMGVVNFADCAA